MPTVLDFALKLLEAVFTAGGDVYNAYEKWNEENDLVKQMVKEGRNPTQAEYDALLAKSQANTDEINRLANS